ncbi:MAG: hypothetical protein Q4F77_07405 [Acinetobacter sp.]|uniref:hypothetical protein n=1 Tax=Acinetobacter sp. TaxID=472 RepID=UPI0026E027AD|nr:hypothetical protein [Acinetobacter sp.]MDO5543124.1 hypothetical protein [Acinetobacter sp.]
MSQPPSPSYQELSPTDNQLIKTSITKPLKMVAGAGFEPTTFAKLSRVEPDGQSTNQNRHYQTIKMVAGAGFEPTTFGL